MNARSKGPRSLGSSSSALPLTTSMRSATPASRQYARARSVRERSGSIVTMSPSAGSAVAIQSAEYPVAVPTSTIRRAAVARTSTRSACPMELETIGMFSAAASASIFANTPARSPWSSSRYRRS